MQQGCNAGPLCCSTDSLKILEEFTANPTMSGARTVLFTDVITAILPPELFLDMATIVQVMEWLQEHLRVEYISLNHRNCRSC